MIAEWCSTMVTDLRSRGLADTLMCAAAAGFSKAVGRLSCGDWSASCVAQDAVLPAGRSPRSGCTPSMTSPGLVGRENLSKDPQPLGRNGPRAREYVADFGVASDCVHQRRRK